MHSIDPKAVWLTVNRNCNFRCSWCYARDTNYDTKKSMTPSLAINLIDVVADLGVKNLLFIGGEPTLWPHLLEMNVYCKRKDIQTVLVTNAFRFSDDNFWEKYLKCPNNTAGISLKAGTPEQLAKNTSVQKFDLMRAGIARAVEYFKTGIGITYNAHYRGYLPEMVKFAIDCGAGSVKIDFCTISFVDGIATKQDMMDPRDIVRDIVSCYDELDKITDGRLAFEMQMPLCIWPYDFIEMLKNKRQILSVCHVLKRQGLVFDTDGKILICNGLFDYPIGQYGQDFIDAKSLKDFLDNQQIVSCYDRLACYPSRLCATCIAYSECGGGCPLKWAAYNPNELITAQYGK